MSEELKKKAEDLGIEVDGRWSEKRLQKEIDAALSKDEEQKKAEVNDTNQFATVQNLMRGGVLVDGVRIAPNSTKQIDITTKQAKRSIELKMIKVV